MFLFQMHSGLRYLVLLAGLVSLAFFASRLIGRRGFNGRGRIINAVFTGILDLQVLVGFILFFAAQWPKMVIGHLAMMLGAAILQHAVTALNKRREQPSPLVAFIGTLVVLALIVGGIMAIGRPIVGS